MKRKITCPFGSECETASDGVIETCALYVGMEMIATDGTRSTEHKCSLAWNAILSAESNKQQYLTSAAITSMREENTKRQDIALEVMSNAKISSTN